MPQFTFDHPVATLGAKATANSCVINSYANELLAQISALAFSGNLSAGDYTFQVEGPEGVFAFTLSAAGGETPAAASTAFVALLDVDPDALGLFAASDLAPGVGLDFLHTGAVYTLTITSNPGGVMSVSTSQAAGGTEIGLGLGVVPGTGEASGAPHVRAPEAGTVDADFLGVSTRETLDVLVNEGNVTTPNVYAPGSVLAVMEEGDVWVRTEDSAAFNGAVYMRTQNGTTDAPLGGFRSDDGGGDAILISGARFRTASTGPGLVRLTLNRP